MASTIEAERPVGAGERHGQRSAAGARPVRAGVVAGTFLGSKLASLLGLLPVGVWTVNHLWDNLAALRGGAAWERAVTEHSSPATQAVTLAVVLVPLLLHSGWGLARLPRTRVPRHVGRFASLRHGLHRLSALGLLLFLGAHLWLALIRPRLLEGGPEPFEHLAHQMRFHLPTLIVYVLGVLGTAYHLANGLQAVGVGWGLRFGRGTMSRLSLTSGAAFVVLLAMGWTAVWALWRAGGG
ncbi:succinate dehydrogenase [Anaeromyxobacter sp. SG17]|uniref:succinate dehydrogenase n=1 Tax=Anaeromyxobacter sp. SG17 TaxID=2925405 RepID=UPI001F562E07|nr:succinate dehydrogenase [Anaeromyxobacter sp. SG17]